MARGIYNCGKTRCDVCKKLIVKIRPNQKRCGTNADGGGMSECQRIAETVAVEMRKDKPTDSTHRLKAIVKTRSNTNRQWRRCLKCGNRFKSTNVFNRICKACDLLNESVCYHAHKEHVGDST